MNRQLWIGTNWKMNHKLDDARQYADQLGNYCATEKPSANIFICAPFTVLYGLADALKDTKIITTAQNTHWLDRGAATGEISPLQIKDTGASMVEIGHSERREMFAETDETVNKKILAALRNKLRPLVCVGETAQDKQRGRGEEKLSIQIKTAFRQVKAESVDEILVAYEPVWAIGESGSPASPDYADKAQAYIKKILCEIFGQENGGKIPVLYGGSVNRANAVPLVKMPNIDGLFIGRAGWQADGFIEIIALIENALHPHQ
jgi:triosephosphate isomerase